MSDQPEKTRRAPVVYWVFVFSLFFFLGLSILLNIGLGISLALATHSSFATTEETAEDEFPAFEEQWSFGTGDVKVVRMELTGFITRESEAGFLEPAFDKIENLLLAIRAATNDEDVKAIIFEVDSPGGSVTSSDELYTALMNFKASHPERKVIVYMRDLAASGGYYIAMAGDWLIAQPTTLVGSIGVIMQSLNWKGLSERIGITDTTIKSGENKDLLNPFRETSPEQIAMLQEMIDRMYQRFIGLVSANRGMDDEALKTLADGRVFSGDQALELKLVDQIGYWDDVMAKTEELLNVSSIKVIRYYQPYGLWDYLIGAKRSLNILPKSLSYSPPRLQYLWQP
jgi:protease-4